VTTADLPACADCPQRGPHPFTPDARRGSAVAVLLDRAGDPPPPKECYAAARLDPARTTLAYALRCRPPGRPLTGKKLDKAVATCRAYDDWTGVRCVVVVGKVGWRALGLDEWGSSRGYARGVNV
jgi:hypothetical protein